MHSCSDFVHFDKYSTGLHMKHIYTLAFAAVFSLSLMSFYGGDSSVSITSFNAIANGQKVMLSWSNDIAGVLYYEVEKSKNGNDYTTIAKIEPGAQAKDFIETDFTPYDGLSWYRVKIVTEAGDILFSNVVPVKYLAGNPVSPAPLKSGSVYENPVIVVVRDAQGEEHYSKVSIEKTGDPLEGKDLEQRLNNGAYIIVSCSEQAFYCKQLYIK